MENPKSPGENPDAASHAEDLAEGAAADAREALEKIEAATAAAAENKASVEIFELCAAILLGLGATFGTIAGYQGGLWGGKSAESFSQSNVATTKSADAGTYADAQIAHDVEIKTQTMLLVAAAEVTPDGPNRDLLLHQISELYIREYSDSAYDALGLPLEPRKKYDADGELVDFPDKVIAATNKQDFNKDYYSWMYEEKVKHAEEALKLYQQAQDQGNIGDQFALNGVYFTLSLFFAGLGLVFKSRVRWAFLGLGTLVFLGAVIYMFRLSWA